MAGTDITPEENELLGALPRCCGCNKLIYQFATAVLLPCTHFLYCESCFEEWIQRSGMIMCNLCGSQYSDLDRDSQLCEISESIRALYDQESAPAIRIPALQQLQLRISAVYDRYLNPTDSRYSEPIQEDMKDGTGPSLRNVAELPLEDVPAPSNGEAFQCQACGLTVLAGQYRCQCGLVDLAAFQACHPNISHIAITKALVALGQEPVDDLQDQEASIESNELEIPPKPDVSGASPPSPPPPNPLPEPPKDPVTTILKQSAAYMQLIDDENLTNSAVALSSTPLPIRRPRPEDEVIIDDATMRRWAKIAIVVVILVLLYDIIQVNRDA